MINRKEFVEKTFKNLRMPAYLISKDAGYVAYTLPEIVEELSEKFADEDDEEFCELISGIEFLSLSEVVSMEQDRFLRAIEDDGTLILDLYDSFFLSTEKHTQNALWNLIFGTLCLEHKIKVVGESVKKL